jgi:predicted DNA-binding protein
MQQSRSRNFHVPLPEELYQALRSEAERRGRPATALVREVLEEWGERLRAETLHSEIVNYAAKNAGSSADIDAELEAAGIELLTKEPGKAKPARRRAKRK